MPTPGHGKHLLLVEDDEAIRDLVTFHLRMAQYDVLAIGDGAKAADTIRERQFDLIILDVVLPHIDGITICQSLRRDGPNKEVPVMMLTARHEEVDKVLALDGGADDYLTKPFGVRELMARVNALLRRPRSTWRTLTRAREQPSLSLLGIIIDPTRHRVTVNERTVMLTPQEFGLLYLLMSNPGVVFNRDELLERVWQEDVFVTSRGVDALVKRLRRKIEIDPSHPLKVITVWGAGYKFGDF